MIKNFEGFLRKMMDGYPTPAYIIIFLDSSILILCLVPEKINKGQSFQSPSWKMRERKELYLH